MSLSCYWSAAHSWVLSCVPWLKFSMIYVWVRTNNCIKIIVKSEQIIIYFKLICRNNILAQVKSAYFIRINAHHARLKTSIFYVNLQCITQRYSNVWTSHQTVKAVGTSYNTDGHVSYNGASVMLNINISYISGIMTENNMHNYPILPSLYTHCGKAFVMCLKCLFILKSAVYLSDPKALRMTKAIYVLEINTESSFVLSSTHHGLILILSQESNRQMLDSRLWMTRLKVSTKRLALQRCHVNCWGYRHVYHYDVNPYNACGPRFFFFQNARNFLSFGTLPSPSRNCGLASIKIVQYRRLLHIFWNFPIMIMILLLIFM